MGSVTYPFWGKKFAFRTNDTFCDHVAITGRIVYIQMLIGFSVPVEVDLSGVGVGLVRLECIHE